MQGLLHTAGIHTIQLACVPRGVKASARCYAKQRKQHKLYAGASDVSAGGSHKGAKLLECVSAYVDRRLTGGMHPEQMSVSSLACSALCLWAQEDCSLCNNQAKDLSVMAGR